MNTIPAPTGEAPAADPPANPSEAPAPTEGARPAWIPEDAWDGEAKAPKLDALEQLVTSAGKDKDVPATVDAYAPPTIEGLAPEAITANPAYKSFAALAHKSGIGAEKFGGFVKEWIETAMAEDTANAETTKKALGENADARLQTLSNSMAGKLTPEEHAAVRANMTDPLVITALEKLAAGATSAAPRTPTVLAPSKSEEDIRKIMQSKAYSGNEHERDPAVIKEVTDWFAAKHAAKA